MDAELFNAAIRGDGSFFVPNVSLNLNRQVHDSPGELCSSCGSKMWSGAHCRKDPQVATITFVQEKFERRQSTTCCSKVRVIGDDPSSNQSCQNGS